MRDYRFTFLSLLMLLAVSLLGSGCSDALTSAEPGPAAEAPRAISKMRHAHLLGQPGANKVLERNVLLTYTDFIVGTADGVDFNRVIERYEAETGVDVRRVFRRVYRGFKIKVNPINVPGLLDLIEFDDDIAWIEPDPRFMQPPPGQSDYPGGNHQTLPWGVERIGGATSPAQSGDESGTVSGVEIFVLDSGVKYHDVSEGLQVSFLDNGATNDALGHGTHVAGTAAARDNSFGVVGVAPGATVHNLRVLDAAGFAEFSTVIAAVEYVTDYKAAHPDVPVVVNLSLGADIGTTAYNALDEAVASSIAQGVVYVISAGNEGIDASTVTPAHVAEAITVGAYDANDAFASFSNHGPLVDLLAPGVDIPSLSNETGAKKPPVVMTGTSMAAPHVTGAAALYLWQHPDASPAEVAAALDAAAQGGISGAPAGTTDKTVFVGM